MMPPDTRENPETEKGAGQGAPIQNQPIERNDHNPQASCFQSLRPYQADVIRQFGDEVAQGRNRVLLVAPTGAGKTVIAAEAVGNAVRDGKRVLFLAHRRELITQTSVKLHGIKIEHGIILAGMPSRPGEAVQVAAIPTLHARAFRSRTIELPPADLVIIDEAHHVRARTYRQIIDAYPNAVILGLTATACRDDGRGLGPAFDCIVECPDVAELIAGGYLVKTNVYAPSQPDLTGIKVARGDYIERDLAARVNTAALVGDVVTHWHRLASDRPTVIFATGVAHSIHLRDEFRRSGVVAEHIDGKTPSDERDNILKALAAGKVDVVCNAMVLTEGWDCPSVSCLVLARPTKSLGLYRQMVGRVLRPALGKSDALILDHSGATFQHGFAEDPIKWTLQEDRKAENVAQSRRNRAETPSLTTCRECQAIRMEGKPCPACGWRPVTKPKAVKFVDGDLAAVDRERRTKQAVHTESEQRRWLGELTFIARERGYQPGWASHKFKEKFGAWPAHNPVDPIAPSAEVRSWVRSRQIAFIKGSASSVAR